MIQLHHLDIDVKSGSQGGRPEMHSNTASEWMAGCFWLMNLPGRMGTSDAEASTDVVHGYRRWRGKERGG